jgi:hypothetical protein
MVKVAATAPEDSRAQSAWIEEILEWLGDHGGNPEIAGEMWPSGVRPAEHENDMIAMLYKACRTMLLEFDDPNLAILFKLRFGGMQ